MLRRSSRFLILGAFLLVPALQSCAVNPVTGERQFVLFTEAQEIQLGREADQDITAQLGEYEDEALQQWLDDMGQRMAADSERPDLPWTFRVLDDPTVNAFALPGGFIYITRGIMAHLSTDAELAAIVGHEIGHVTARHGVTRVSRAQLAQLGLGIGMVLAPELRPFGEAAGVGLQLLFLRNSREAERQADDLGLRYMSQEDYDPRAAARVFEMLARASGAEDGDRLPGFLSTHPDPLERRERILQQTTGDPPEFSGTRDSRDEYLNRLDGMIFGTDPRQGYFRNGQYSHPDMRFRLDYPSGWRTANTRTEVQGISPEQDAVLLVSLVEETSPSAARQRFLAGQGIETVGRSDEAVNTLPAAWAEFRVRGENATFRGRVVFIRHGERTFQVLGYSTDAAWGARQGALTTAMRSFRELTDPAALNAQPRRIQVVRTEVDLTLEGFIQRHPSTVPLETIGVINGFRPGEVVPGGTLMKRVVGEGPPGEN